MRPPRRILRLWLCLVAALAAALAVNLAGRRLALAALAASLRSTLGAADVRVDADSWPPLALWWGRIDELDIRATHVPAGALELAEFRARFRHLRFDPGALYRRRTLVLRSAPAGTAQGVISEAALAAAVRQGAGVRMDRLSLRPGRVLVRATVNVFGADLPVEGAGRLVLAGGNTLAFVLDGADAGGAVLATKGGGADTPVPVLRLPPLPLGLRLNAVHVGNGVLVLDATTNPL